MRHSTAPCHAIALIALLFLAALAPAPSAHALGVNSCQGTNACTGADTAMIGDNSCNGDFSCYYLHPQSVITNSCVGLSACSAANTIGLTMTISTGSCNGPSACGSQNNPNPVISIGPNSCNGQAACAGWSASFFVQQGNACNGFFACQGYNGAVGQDSCLGTRACAGRFSGYGVSNRSCVGTDACNDSHGNIGNDSCNGNEACFHDYGRVANSSCNGQDVCMAANVDVPDCAMNAVRPAGCTNPELAVTVSDGTTRATPGSPAVYTIIVSNTGLTTESNATVADAFPAALTGCSVTSLAYGGASGNDAGPTAGLNDTGVVLPPAASVTYTATCGIAAAATGSIADTATVTSATLDPVPFNNSASDVDELAYVVTAFGTVADSGDGVLDEGETLTGGPTQLLVDFSGAMLDPPGNTTSGDVTDPANYLLLEAGPNGTIDTGFCVAAPSGDDVEVVVPGIAYGAQRAALASLTPLALPKGKYRLDACAALQDASGYPIVARSRAFDVLGTNRMSQPNFDADLAGWTLVDPAPGALAWNAADAGGAASSGSARVDTTAGTGLEWNLTQCVAAGDHYDIARFRARIQSATSGAPAALVSVRYFSAPGCTGSSIPTFQSDPVVGDTAGQWLASTIAFTPPRSGQSARVVLRIVGDTASTFTADVDDVFFGDPETVFGDGYE